MTSPLPLAAAVVYCGTPPAPGAWASAWTTEPLLWALVGAWALLTAWWRPRSGAAWGAWALGALLYLSPLCALSAGFFSARVLHHVLLTAGVAPLLALALRSAAPPRAWALTAAFALFAVAMWLWHAPAAYAWGLTTRTGYWLMQASLLGAAVWLWHTALAARGALWPAVLALLGTVAHMGLLGALIAFATQALYPLHAPTVLAWGWQPLADQQLGGLLMWVPAGVPFLAAALWRVQVALRGAGLPTRLAAGSAP
ncbi:MAG: cytochrome c oxidase assembly protein [Pseudomonadota bacterium]|nr:cytochrome c oxidase assembly protein [Pseudomonadota bacterium]